MKFIEQAALSLALVLAAASAAHAQSTPQAAQDVTVQLSAARIVAAPGGAETRASADAAKPGEVIEYRAVYRNNDKTTARVVQATLPVPAGTEYLAASASPQPGLRASLDGQRYDAVPLMRRVKRADGQTVDVAVPAAEYRFLRWNLGDLAAQREAVVSARVRVQANESVASAAVAAPIK